MANKRNLKKDIRFLVEIVIIEAIEISEVTSSEAGRQKALETIVKLAGLHNQLISRVNHPDGKENRAMVKKHYRSIIDELISGCDEAYNELNQVQM